MSDWSFDIKRTRNGGLWDGIWNGRSHWHVVIWNGEYRHNDRDFVTHYYARKWVKQVTRTDKRSSVKEKSRRQIRKEKKLELKLGMPQ